MQDDVHIPVLTVEETLYYSCWTRAPSLVTERQRYDRVNLLLKLMGIDHIAKSVVGDAMTKGISGGQLKRLSIAVELVNLPDIIFLDEPTSGLDSSISLEVMTAVKNIVKNYHSLIGEGSNSGEPKKSDKLCISTIHQPSPEVFELFDKLVLMSAGRLIFYGDTMDAVKHFQRLGYRYLEGSNPAEFIIAVGGGSVALPGEKKPKQPHELEEDFTISAYYRNFNVIKRELNELITSKKLKVYDFSNRIETTSFSTQLKMLIHRSWTAKIRDHNDLKAQFLKNLIIGLLIGIVFFGQGEAKEPLFENGIPTAGTTTVCSILFFTMMFTMIGNLQAIPYLSSQNIIYRRELASKAYRPEPYWVSQLVTTLPIQFFYHFIFIVTMFFLVKLPTDSSYFFYFFFLLFLANICAFYSAMWLSVSTGSEQVAFAVFPILFLFISNFAGYSINVEDVSDFWIWAPYLSYGRWIFEGLMVNQWKDFDTTSGDVLAMYSFDDYDQGVSFAIIIIFIAFFAILTYIGLRPQKKRVEHLENEEMLSSSLSIYDKSFQAEDTSASRPSVARSSVMVPRQSTITKVIGPSTLQRQISMRETLTNTTKIEDDEFLTLPEELDVNFYRKSTGNFEKISGVDISFHDIHYSVPDKLNPSVKTKLLNGITGKISAGEMCALMGASGAGKSTLLDVLANRKNTGEIVGQITYNSSPKIPSMAYVMQDNVHIGLLTVRESLYFAAKFRLPETTSVEDINKRVDKILAMLGLTMVQHTTVGNENIRGISGGQLKRLSIGVEIINLPAIMFLDEPTTGLDSSISLEVMSAVRNLADQNRTVICTIHQPSIATFNLFDKLLLLAKGRIIYFGSVSKVTDYFTNSVFQFNFKTNSNPADFVVAIAGGFVPDNQGNQVSGDQLADYYSHNAKTFDISYSIDNSNLHIENEEVEEVVGDYITSTKNQAITLLSRNLLKTKRDRRATVVTAFRHIIVGLFYGSLYFNINGGTDPSSYSNRLGLFFFTLMFMVIGHQQSIPALLEDRLIFYRERGSKSYGPFTYWISQWAIQIPLIILNTLLYSAVLYPMVKLNAYAENGDSAFGFFYLTMILTSTTGMFIACFISSLAQSTQAALSLYPILLFFSVSFAGFLVYIPEFPLWLRAWAPYISFMRFSFQGLVLNEFNNNSDLPYGSSYIDSLGFDSFDKSTCIGVQFVFLFFYGIAFLFGLKYINFEKR